MKLFVQLVIALGVIVLLSALLIWANLTALWVYETWFAEPISDVYPIIINP